ncbi:MAG: ABC transporter ATP-binding protein [Ruminococcus callidus]|nr:ABC transporter ATP-binding protein [Ruminococcus callidus]
MEPIIDASHVYIRYLLGDFRDIGLKEWTIQKVKRERRVESRWSVEDVSFTLEKGDFLGIIGANGAGKSTILKAICGILPPAKGSIQVNGNISALLELGTGFDGDLNLIENIYMRGALLGYEKDFITERIDEIIEFAELKEFQFYKYKQLSSGMRSRLAFAIACMVDPEILILDEVLSVGDGGFRRKSEQKMMEVIQSGATTLFVSHSVAQMKRLCNKVLWLDMGKQIAFAKNKQESEKILTCYSNYMKERAINPAAKPSLMLPAPAKKPAAKKPAGKPTSAKRLASDIQYEIYSKAYIDILNEMVLHPETVDQFKAYFQDKHITHLAIYGESMVLKTIAVLLKDAGVSVDYLLENGKKSSEYAKTIHSRDIHKYPDTQCILIGDVRFEKNILEKVHKRTKIPVITISEAMHYKKDSKKNTTK